MDNPETEAIQEAIQKTKTNKIKTKKKNAKNKAKSQYDTQRLNTRATQTPPKKQKQTTKNKKQKTGVNLGCVEGYYDSNE